MGIGWNFKNETTPTCSRVAELELKYELQAQLSALHLRYMSRGNTADFQSEWLISNVIEKQGNNIKLLLHV